MTTRTYRFAVRLHDWTLQMWEVPGDIGKVISSSTTGGKGADTQPQWLQDIVSVASAANQIMRVGPPPMAVLWFSTDEHNNLLRFDNPAADYP